ncbi:MAG: hypothetical protein EPO32_05310 [Anaerolineae bacterium]|nr:MAG: hypothetical protein EPO32_05310 [Anaerolineae bacterium]
MKKKLITLFIVLTIVSLACNISGGSSEAEATLQALSVQTTLEAIQRQTAEAGGQPVAPAGNPTTDTSGGQQPPAAGATATDTPVPAATFTSTVGVPLVSVSVDTNCRIGPGNVYDYRGALLVGEVAEIVAVDPSGNYYYIPNPDGSGYCWVWAEYATVEGSTAGLPVYTPPPTPTPTYTPTPIAHWAGSWSLYIEPFAASYPLSLTQSGLTVSGSFDLGGVPINVVGTVSADGMTVTGTWTNSSTSDSGSFVWKLKANLNQFVGNFVDSGTTYGWCGYRNGASVPSPCLGP